MKPVVGVIGAWFAAMCLLSGLTAVPASAASLCYEEVAKCPAGQRVPAKKRIVGHNLGNSVWHAHLGSLLTCTTSELEDEVMINAGGVASISAEMKALAFGGCKESAHNTNCKVKTVPEPVNWLTIIRWEKNGTVGPNGEFELSSVEVKVECNEIPKTCDYLGTGQFRKFPGKIYNAGDTNKPSASLRSELYYNEVELTSVTGGGFCGEGATHVTAIYSITDNSMPAQNLYVSQE